MADNVMGMSDEELGKAVLKNTSVIWMSHQPRELGKEVYELLERAYKEGHNDGQLSCQGF